MPTAPVAPGEPFVRPGRLGAVLLDVDRTLVDDVLNARIALTSALMEERIEPVMALRIAELTCRLAKQDEPGQRQNAGWPLAQALMDRVENVLRSTPWEALTGPTPEWSELWGNIEDPGDPVSPYWFRQEGLFGAEGAYRRLQRRRQQLLTRAARQCGVRLDDTATERVLRRAVAVRQDPDRQELMPYAGELLRWLHEHDIPVVAVTSGWDPWQRSKCRTIEQIMRRRFGVDFSFASVQTSTERFGNGAKPGIAGAVVALSELTLRGDTIAMVGDSPSSDLLTALRLASRPTAHLAMHLTDTGQLVTHDEPPSGATPVRVVPILYDTAERPTDRSAVAQAVRAKMLDEIRDHLTMLAQEMAVEHGDRYIYPREIEEEARDLVEVSWPMYDHGGWHITRDHRQTLTAIESLENGGLRARPGRGAARRHRAPQMTPSTARRSIRLPSGARSRHAMISEASSSVTTGLPASAALAAPRVHQFLYDAGLPVARHLMPLGRTGHATLPADGLQLSLCSNTIDQPWVVDEVARFIGRQSAFDPLPLLSTKDRRPRPVRHSSLEGAPSIIANDRANLSRSYARARMARIQRALHRDPFIAQLFERIGFSTQSIESLSMRIEAMTARPPSLVQERIDPRNTVFVEAHQPEGSAPEFATPRHLVFSGYGPHHIGDPLEQAVNVLRHWRSIDQHRSRFLTKLRTTAPWLGPPVAVRRDLQTLMALDGIEKFVEAAVAFRSARAPRAPNGPAALRASARWMSRATGVPVDRRSIARWIDDARTQSLPARRAPHRPTSHTPESPSVGPPRLAAGATSLE